MCEETASFDLTSFDIASCIEDVAQCIEFIECREHNELDADEGTGTYSVWLKSHCCVFVFHKGFVFVNIPVLTLSGSGSVCPLFVSAGHCLQGSMTVVSC